MLRWHRQRRHMWLWLISEHLPKQMSNETYPGWLGYIGDYTTQLYKDYNKPLPGNSAGDLFGMVKTWPFKWRIVTSNWGIKRSRIESPGIRILINSRLVMDPGCPIFQTRWGPHGRCCQRPTLGTSRWRWWKKKRADGMKIWELYYLPTVCKVVVGTRCDIYIIDCIIRGGIYHIYKGRLYIYIFDKYICIYTYIYHILGGFIKTHHWLLWEPWKSIPEMSSHFPKE